MSKMHYFGNKFSKMVVVLIPNLFRGMGAWRNSTEIQQAGHAPRSGLEVKNGSSAKDGVQKWK